MPSDILFQNESSYFEKEYESNKTGNITFLIEQSKQEAFLTFLFDLEEHNQLKKESLIRECLFPVIISLIIVAVILCINIYLVRKNLYKPINTISRLSKNICNGDYSQDYLQVNEVRNEANEITNLVSSFELMRDELKVKQETEERLRQSEKELISCMSHDLQTPLSTIKAYAEAIRDNVAQNEEEKNKYLEVILKKTNTMIDMIQDLLTYSNSQLGQLPMEFSEIMLRDFFYPLLEELKYYAKEKFVRVLKKGVCPETKWVEGSNYVDINFVIDDRTGRIVMMGALDNLVKGAAGQAVQNMNLLFGFDEAEGLNMVPMFP